MNNIPASHLPRQRLELAPLTEISQTQEVLRKFWDNKNLRPYAMAPGYLVKAGVLTRAKYVRANTLFSEWETDRLLAMAQQIRQSIRAEVDLTYGMLLAGLGIGGDTALLLDVYFYGMWSEALDVSTVAITKALRKIAILLRRKKSAPF